MSILITDPGVEEWCTWRSLKEGTEVLYHWPKGVSSTSFSLSFLSDMKIVVSETLTYDSEGENKIGNLRSVIQDGCEFLPLIRGEEPPFLWCLKQLHKILVVWCH